MRRKLIVTGALILSIALILTGTYKLMNLRNYQVFGNLIDSVQTKEKVVALTFDDGPTDKIEKILPLLEEYNAKATFFLIGSELEKNMDLGQKIVKAGHDIGNHTYSHERMIFKKMSFIKDEITKTNELIRQTGYRGEIDFRPPNGKKLIALPYYLDKENIETIMWDLEPDTYNSSRSEKISYVKNNIKPGSILLLHPMYDEDELQTLEGILKSLSEEGYSFTTVNELQSINGS
ncbi:polysaccharide deacetylase family protein [Metabacillus litoralis]|uniref:polysaccharide deacetylase family protein n=1 Tax=Metabacillus litoralis TaxID=152268 RepID=UPI00204164E2|nr:polysaccharide deacetylase family protein [Metabacillus litoralis]MCM3409347.1 polysaccharide deacetylase family protein [Metabacillus litoralis]